MVMPPTNPTSSPLPMPGPAPNNQSSYDFFLHPAPTPKPQRFRLNFGSSSFIKKVIILVGGAVGLIIVFAIISSLIGGGSNITPLINVAQDQNELVRVATEATGQATLQTTQNLGQSVELSLTSAQQQLLKYLKDNGHTISSSQLQATKNSQTDKQLTAAASASDFDGAFTTVMQSQLKAYLNDINSAYSSVGPKGKALLKNQYNGGKLLLSEATATIDTLQ